MNGVELQINESLVSSTLTECYTRSWHKTLTHNGWGFLVATKLHTLIRVDVWFFRRSGSSKRVCWRRPKTERATLVAFHRPSSRRRKTPPCVCVSSFGPAALLRPLTGGLRTAAKPPKNRLAPFLYFRIIFGNFPLWAFKYASLDIRLLDPKHLPKIFRLLSRPKNLLSH
jgi:hypothetical protein